MAHHSEVAATLTAGPHGVRSDRQESPIGDSKTQADAADLLNVGKRSVERARTILEDGTPELIEAVERERLSPVRQFQVPATPAAPPGWTHRRASPLACAVVIYIRQTIYGTEAPGTALVCETGLGCGFLLSDLLYR